MSYFTTDLDFPVCNHTEGIGSENLGYTKGITEEGVPFEAELVDSEGTLSLVVIMPAVFEHSTKKAPVNKSNVIGITYKVDTWDDSILDIGMVDNGPEEDDELVHKYVDYLVDEGLVTFASNLLNGSVMNRVDILGNDLVKILITLTEDDEYWAYTDLNTIPFEKANITKITDFKKKR